MTDEMVEALASDPVLAGRTAESPEWTWSLDRVTNRTEHPMSESSKWLVMTRIRSQLAQSALPRERSLRFVLPPEAWKRYGGGDFSPTAARLTPTHALRATFHSDTNTSIERRSDYYLCAFHLLDLEDGRIIWEDDYQVKYMIRRNRFD